MIVYEVAEIDVEDHNTVGVFSMKDVAEKAREIASKIAWHSNVEIIEHEVDVLEPMILAGLRQFTTWAYLSGRVDVEEAFPSCLKMIECCYVSDMTPEGMEAYIKKFNVEIHIAAYDVWARNAEEAREITRAAEARRLNEAGY